MSLYGRVIARYRRWRLRRIVGALGKHSMIIQPEFISGGHRLFLEDGVRIWPHARIECLQGGEIHIGAGTSAQLYFHCAAAASVRIGCNVLIAGRVYISDHDHAWPESKSNLIVAPVTIGDRCWLGEGCAVLKGVELGHDCVVGANAVVTRSAPPGSMLVGVPARIIKRYDFCQREWVGLDRGGPAQ